MLESIGWNDEEFLRYNQAEKYEGAYRAAMAQQFEDGKKKGQLEEKMNIARSMIKKKID